MLKWLLLGLSVVSAMLGFYCLGVSRAAQKVVTAANGPPVLRVPIDFSKPFTNEFEFRNTVQPFYGTTYLTLKADPWPAIWTEREIAAEDLKAAKGEIRILSTHHALIDRTELNWFYDRIPRSEPTNAPLQGLYARLPGGDYRLLVATTSPVPQLNGTKQELVLRYDYIHEASIATALRLFGIVFTIVAAISGAAFVWQTKLRPRQSSSLKKWSTNRLTKRNPIPNPDAFQSRCIYRCQICISRAR